MSQFWARTTKGIGVEMKEELARRIIASVATGLYDLHALGLVHRDIKPANILVALADGTEETSLVQIYIADFGVTFKVSSGH